MAGTHVFEVTAATFQKEVIESSVQTPVLLDFWAEWCGPCKTLGPILEDLAEAFDGAFRLGKVDTEKEQDLAYAFGVQGIPFCVLLVAGKPVDGFQGALPVAEVHSFLTKHGITPADSKPRPKVEVEVEADPDSPEGRLKRAHAAARAGDPAAVREALAGFPEEEEGFDQAERLLTGIEWLEAALADSGSEAEQALLAARAVYVAGDHDAAMHRILESVAADKGFRDGLARKAMLLCFAAVGEESEQLDGYRRQLATLLY